MENDRKSKMSWKKLLSWKTILTSSYFPVSEYEVQSYISELPKMDYIVIWKG